VAHNYIPGRWDGVRWLSAVINPDDSTTVLVLQRNQGNTSTTTLPATPVHPTGIVTDMALSYDYTSKDVRVYAVGTSTDVLYFTTYNRLTTTWAAWATVTATAVLNGGSEFSVRKGGTNGNSEYDVVTAHSGAPNTIVSIAQTVSSQPNLPVWDTSAQPYVNGGAADVAAALSLTWIFSDPDAGQTQGSYALSRQIGTGTIAYWNAGTSTWVASEVQNATGTVGRGRAPHLPGEGVGQHRFAFCGIRADVAVEPVHKGQPDDDRSGRHHQHGHGHRHLDRQRADVVSCPPSVRFGSCV
jgi:hypothetical protein